MPLQKRKIYSGSSYAHSELWEDSEPSTILSDVNMGNTLGVMHQIGYLSSYCFEIFDGLTSLTDDMRSRLVMVGKRANSLVDNIEQLEQRRAAQRINKMNPDFGKEDIVEEQKEAKKSLSFSPAILEKQDNTISSSKQKEKISNTQAKSLFLSNRDSEIPDVLSTETNCSQIKSAYNMCSVAPSLWKIDDLLDEDYSLNYSNPGFFFAEWLRIEQERQAMYKAEQTKARQIRKAMKNERRQLRELTEDQQRELFRQKNVPGKGGRNGSVQSMRTSLLSAALYDNSGVMVDKDRIRSKKADKKKKKKDKRTSSIDSDNVEEVSNRMGSTGSEEEKSSFRDEQENPGESLSNKKSERVSKIGGMFNSFFGSSAEGDSGDSPKAKKDKPKEKTKEKTQEKTQEKGKSENEEERPRSTLGYFSRMFGGNSTFTGTVEDEKEIETTAGIASVEDDSTENTPELSAREKAKLAKSRAKQAKRGNSFSIETNKADGLMSQEDMDISQSPMTPRERRQTIKDMLANAEDIKKISNDEDDESSDDNEESKSKRKLAMSTKSRRSSKSNLRRSIIPSSSDKEKLLGSLPVDKEKGKSEEKEKEKSPKFIDSSSDEDSGSDDDSEARASAKKSEIDVDSNNSEEDKEEEEEEESSSEEEESSESEEDSSSEDYSSSSSDSSSVSSSNESQDAGKGKQQNRKSSFAAESIASSSPNKSVSKRNLAPPPPPPMGGKSSDYAEDGKRRPPPPPPSGATGNRKSGPPPPPPVSRPRLGSALKMGIAQGMQLRKAEAPQPRPADLRQNMLAAIKKGGPSLRKVERPSIVQKQRQMEAAKPPTAITAILQNRRHIAGSDSDDTDDSSDSDMSF